MNRILIFLGLLFSAGSSFGQIAIHTYNGGVEGADDVSGTTIYHNTSSNSQAQQAFHVKNLSGSPMNLAIERYRVDEVAGWTDNITWGSTDFNAFDNTCYAPSTMSTNPWTSMYVTIPSGTYDGILTINVNTNSESGCALYRYYVVEDSVRLDSVDVQVCTTLGLEEQGTHFPEFYPNPASSELHLLPFAGASEQTTIQLIDPAGRMVYITQPLSEKTVDVSKLENGIYLLKLLENNVTVTSRQLLIQR